MVDEETPQPSDEDRENQFAPSIPPQPYTNALLKSRLVTARSGQSFAWYEGRDGWKERIRARLRGDRDC